MIVRMVVGLSGPTLSLEPGDERDFPRDEAIRLLKAGYAVPVLERRIETTDAPPAHEIRRRGRQRKQG